jgi:hypothetical protein
MLELQRVADLNVTQNAGELLEDEDKFLDMLEKMYRMMNLRCY